MRRTIETVALVLVIVGGLNWGLVGIAKIDLVAEIVGEDFGKTNAVSRVIYSLVGLGALILAATRAQASSNR